jgi:hypothetical protein
VRYTREKIEQARIKITGTARSAPSPCICGGQMRLYGRGLSGSQYACTGCDSPFPAPSEPEEGKRGD